MAHMHPEKPLSDWQVVRYLYGFVRPYRKVWYSILAAGLCTILLAPLPTYLIQRTFDRFFQHPGAADKTLQLLFLMLVLMLLQMLAQYSQNYLGAWLGQKIVGDLRINLHRKLMASHMGYFDTTPTGKVLVHVIQDTESVFDVFREGLACLLSESLQLTCLVAVMAYVNLPFTLISLASIPCILLVTYIFKEGLRKAFTYLRQVVGNFNALLQVHLSNMLLIQLSGQEKAELERFTQLSKAHKKAQNRLVYYYSTYYPITEFLQALSIAGLLWYGGYAVLHGYASLGMVSAFVLYIKLVLKPIRTIAEDFHRLQAGLVGTRHILHLMQHELQPQSWGSRSAHSLQGSVRFAQVGFAYAGNSEVLQDISFTVQPKEYIALVGATGSGKTTLMSLLARFYDATAGTIYIDEHPIASYSAAEFHKHVALVPQEVFIFSASIYDNLTMGSPKLSREYVEEVARQVGSHTFISALPGGYDYIVQERGGELSLGQRQLLALTRAMLTNPSILILDEATAALDPLTESVLSKAVETFIRGRTVFVIAHRLHTIEHADRILVLHQGRIQESGTHQELLAKQGYYAELLRTQMAKAWPVSRCEVGCR